MVFDFPKGREVFLYTKDYAVYYSFELYESLFSKALKTYETPFVAQSVLTAQGYEEPGHLAGNAAQVLMKLLWLSRLSRHSLCDFLTSQQHFALDPKT